MSTCLNEVTKAVSLLVGMKSQRAVCLLVGMKPNCIISTCEVEAN